MFALIAAAVVAAVFPSIGRIHVTVPTFARPGQTIQGNFIAASDPGIRNLDLYLITEIGFPALDAASKDAAKMTLKFAPAYAHEVFNYGSRMASPPPPSPTPKPGVTSFSITIPATTKPGGYYLCPFRPYDPRFQTRPGDASACAHISISR